MAWQEDAGTHQHRKQASAAHRKQTKREALLDAADNPPKVPSKRTVKRLGLKFHWRALRFLGGVDTTHTTWYATEEDRIKGLAAGLTATNPKGEPRFTRIEKVER